MAGCGVHDVTNFIPDSIIFLQQSGCALAEARSSNAGDEFLRGGMMVSARTAKQANQQKHKQMRRKATVKVHKSNKHSKPIASVMRCRRSFKR